MERQEYNAEQEAEANAPDRAMYLCAECGSPDIQITAWARPNTEDGRLAVLEEEGPLETAFCELCDKYGYDPVARPNIVFVPEYAWAQAIVNKRHAAELWHFANGDSV